MGTLAIKDEEDTVGFCLFCKNLKQLFSLEAHV